VMTSNVGSQVIQRVTEEGGGEDEMRQAVEDALKARFLPEFLNRIDDTVIFHPLQQTQIRRIVQLQLEELRSRLAANGLSFEITDAAIDQIAEVGCDPTRGAESACFSDFEEQLCRRHHDQDRPRWRSIRVLWVSCLSLNRMRQLRA